MEFSKHSYLIFFRLAASALWLLNLVILTGSAEPVYGSWTLFLLATILSLTAPGVAVWFVCILLPVSSGISQHLIQVYKINPGLLAGPGTDLIIGFSAGLLWKQSARGLSHTDYLMRFRSLSTPMVLLFFWLCFVTLLALVRNFYTGALYPNFSGLKLAVTGFRTSGFFDTWFPLGELFLLSAALTAAYAVFRHLRETPNNRWLAYFFSAICVANIPISIFAGMQQFLKVGYKKGVPFRGVSSFFPDIHSFAGFELLCLGASLIGMKSANRFMKVPFFLSAGLAIGCLFLSQSKGTILWMPVVVFMCLPAAASGNKFRRIVSIRTLGLAAAISGIAFFVISSNPQNLAKKAKNFWSTLSFDTLNELSTRRLEIFEAAWKFFGDFPLSGLGLGLFYRVSSTPGYSPSPALLSLNGENAHNYFLQILSETGVIGLILAATVLLIPLRYGKLNIDTTKLLVAVLLSNVLAHSLLVKEILFLFAILVGIHLWKSSAIQSTQPATVSRFRAWVPIAILAGIVMLDLIYRTNNPPFQYGQQCYQNTNLYQDGWMPGRLLIPYKATDRFAVLELMSAAPYKTDLKVGTEETAKFETYTLKPGETQTIRAPLPESGSDGNLVLTVEHCFNPKAHGVNRDSRYLGLLVRKKLLSSSAPGAAND